MQMRPAGAPGRPGEAKSLPLPEPVARLHVDAVEVAIHAEQAVAVIDEDRPAVEEVVIDCQHLSRRGGNDRRSARRWTWPTCRSERKEAAVREEQKAQLDLVREVVERLDREEEE